MSIYFQTPSQQGWVYTLMESLTVVLLPRYLAMKVSAQSSKLKLNSQNTLTFDPRG